MPCLILSSGYRTVLCDSANYTSSQPTRRSDTTTQHNANYSDRRIDPHTFQNCLVAVSPKCSSATLSAVESLAGGSDLTTQIISTVEAHPMYTVYTTPFMKGLVRCTPSHVILASMTFLHPYVTDLRLYSHMLRRHISKTLAV